MLSNIFTRTVRRFPCPFLLVAAMLGGCSGGRDDPLPALLAGQTVYQGRLPPVVTVTYADKTGEAVTQDVAFQGWVTLYASTTAAPGTVSSAIEENGGTIIDAIPRIGFYTVQVAAGDEPSFLSAMFAENFIIDGEPTSVDVGAAMTALDDFEAKSCGGRSHGQNVETIMQRGGQPVDLIDTDAEAIHKAGLIDELATVTGIPAAVLRWDWVRAEIMSASSISGTDPPRRVINFSLQPYMSDACRQSPGGRCAARAEGNFFLAIASAIDLSTAEVRDNTVVVVCAGNAGADLTGELKSLQPTGLFDHVVVVGGTTTTGDVNTEYNHADVDMVFAPSQDVPITSGVTCSGTSFAAPEVTRVLDDIWRSNPSIRSDEVVSVFRQALTLCGPGKVANSLPTDPSTQQTTPAFLQCARALAQIGSVGDACTIHEFGVVVQCFDFTDVTARQLLGKCNLPGATFIPSCPTDNVVGKCTVATYLPGLPAVTYDVVSYGVFGVACAEAEQQCTMLGSNGSSATVFTPSGC